MWTHMGSPAKGSGSDCPGAYQIKLSFAGDELFAAMDYTQPITITKEEAPALFSPAPPIQVAVGSDLPLAAHLSEDFAPPLAGRTLTITIGTGPGAQSCTTPPTNAAGNAGWKILNVQQPEGVQGLLVHFAGDSYYAASTSGFAIASTARSKTRRASSPRSTR
jgi:hypothetical protein